MKKARKTTKQEDPAPVSPGNGMFSLRERWIILGVIILLLVLVRARLLGVPLERDEGEYAYMGQLLLQGVLPSSAVYTMKFPGTYFMYALFMSLFGQTAQGIHLGLLAVNCVTVLLLFLLGKRLVSDVAAIVAAGSYAVLSLSPSVLGFAAHATHFVTLWAVAGALVLLHAVEKNRPHLFAVSGALSGLALLMKQPGVFFIAFGFLYLLIRLFSSSPAREGGEGGKGQGIRNLVLFSFASLLPLAATLIWLYAAGAFDKFWFWTVRYASTYGTQVSFPEAFALLQYRMRSVPDGLFLLWIAAGLGLLVSIFHRGLRDSRTFILLFSLFSFCSVCPGFYFREHYFITLLPAISLLIGTFFHYLLEKSLPFMKSPWTRFVALGVFALIAAAGVAGNRGYYLHDDPAAVSKTMFGANPFAESVEIAKFIAARSAPADRVLVFGSEPQIYFYTKRRSATGYIYMYELMENQSHALSMQKEMASEAEASKPKFIVDVHVPTSWIVTPESEKYLFGWFPQFLKSGYSLVGVADIGNNGESVYQWLGDIGNYSIQSPSYVLVYERI